MARFISHSLLGATLLWGASPGAAGEPVSPDAAPPISEERVHVVGLPEHKWSFFFDTETMAATSLKGQWGNLTEAEQKRFTGLMAQLIYHAFQRFQRELKAYEVTLGAEERRTDGWFERKFSGRPRDPKDLSLEFTLVFSRDERGQCELKDWIRDELSTVTVYRSQFLKILRNEGFPVLIEKMRTKIKKDTAAPAG
ncbi:MAG: ABC transporter substrate-binding protein [Opitutae bacterium]|nr:ABC transporter substrate-binding protein [Opitutae bacterium]